MRVETDQASMLHSVGASFHRYYDSPATVGLMILAGPILDLLFGWGMARGDGVESTVPVLQISVLGMPFFSAVALYTRGFHAQQDMKTPLRASYHAVVVNLVLSVLLGLILPFGIKGLAAAGVFASASASSYGNVRESLFQEWVPT